MLILLTVVHVFSAALIVLLVLLQSGKGAEISASFAGSSQTVFGSSGGANFFVKLTGGAAAVFMVTSLALTILKNDARKSVFEGISTPASETSAPAVPAPAAPVTNKK
jgi:preprotein translocase subunit SecG